jgi:hypothetical protein
MPLRSRAINALRTTVEQSREWANDGPQKDPDLTDLRSMFTWLRRDARQSKRPWRPAYGWSVLSAAFSARGQGIEAISVLEFGVARGEGLVALESAAEQVEALLGVKITVVGFDTGKGMPAPTDPRDVPFALSTGDFAMDEAKVRSRLKRAQLRLGGVAETIPVFLAEEPPPIGFVSVDVDYYSSTMESFVALEAGPDRLLPRIALHFDDVVLPPWTDFNGERAAIHEFNRTHEHRKISPVYGLRYWLPGPDAKRLWPEKIFVAELFDHPNYGVPESTPHLQGC